MNAQMLMHTHWLKELRFVKQFKKCTDYGDNATPESLWAKLPPVSRTYWENRFYLTK